MKTRHAYRRAVVCHGTVDQLDNLTVGVHRAAGHGCIIYKNTISNHRGGTVTQQSTAAGDAVKDRAISATNGKPLNNTCPWRDVGYDYRMPGMRRIGLCIKNSMFRSIFRMEINPAGMQVNGAVHRSEVNAVTDDDRVAMHG